MHLCQYYYETVNNKTRVLVVDDSPLVRNILVQGLSMRPEIEVVGSARDVFEARDKIIELNPDVMTLDVDMPKMDGVEFLRRLMPQHPIPVVMVSSLTREGAQVTLDALEAGAVDFVPKPSAELAGGVGAMLAELAEKVVAASRINVSHLKRALPAAQKLMAAPAKPVSNPMSDKVVAIGASTGGTEALRDLLAKMEPDAPGILIVQHMPAAYTKAFAERLNGVSRYAVKEAEPGDVVRNGQALVAPGDLHLSLLKLGGTYKTICQPGEKVNGHCPSVDVLMKSVAREAGANAIGVILTGMGFDGAAGLLEMRKAGARTVAQDEETSVVFGMPKVAYEKGAAESLQPLGKIAPLISRLAGEIDVLKGTIH
ncbi:MAG: chemotaxis response regulator protein-glutamate methylesterase [Nitrospinae bacterium]|nr:chemotaxis response regulator protein-glutamate methylesterase [Nitrospinota bacterium]